jgi:phage terminase large subunit-like protein
LYSEQPVSKWCKFPPWPKQEIFLNLTCKEAFFGGAAGGGKSDSLLRAALQYAHLPRYAALILRTTAADLRKAGGLIPRSHEWLSGTGANWNGNESRWTFPSGATLEFSYLSSQTDKYNFKSSEFTFIGFEELSDFREEDYTYMYSRLRQRIDTNIPERIRAVSNPGSEWVKARFITKEIEQDLLSNQIKSIYWLPPRVEEDGPVAIVPSKIRDNPAIDAHKYMRSLMHLNPVERERLMNGDWTIMPTGLVKAQWLRYYVMRDRLVDLLVSRIDPSSGNILHTDEVLFSYDEREEQTFITIDAAGGVEDIEKEHKGKPLSYTAIGHWGSKRVGGDVILRLKRVRRDKGLSYSDMKQVVKEEILRGGKSRTYVENKAMGMALVSDLNREMPIEPISSGILDKVARNAPFTSMMSEGRVYLPKHENSWRLAFESELLGWRGLKEETNDQIDIAGYAAIIVGGFSGGLVRMDTDPRSDTDSLLRGLGVDPLARSDDVMGGGLMKGW